MAGPTEVSPEERARQRQALSEKAMDRKTSAVVALVAIPTVLASLFGKLGSPPFQPLSMKVGLLALVVLLFLASYGAVSAWLVWLLGFRSADTLRKHSMFRESL